VTIVEEALEAWRDAERLLERLPRLHPDHESVALAVASLRETYQGLTTQAAERTPATIERSRESIDTTRALLDRIHAKLEGMDLDTV
jgi:hypothetical protein